MEFIWADYFRILIKAKDMKLKFNAAVKKALKLAVEPAVAELLGCISLSALIYVRATFSAKSELRSAPKACLRDSCFSNALFSAI